MRLPYIRYREPAPRVKQLTPPPPPPPLFTPDPAIHVMPRPPPGSDFYVQVGGPNGLGISLLSKMMFDYLIEHDLVRTIYWTFPQHAFRPDYPPQYHTDLVTLFQRILPSRCVYIPDATDERCVPWQWDHICAIFEIPPQRFPLRANFPRYDTPLVTGAYITLNMKVSALGKDVIAWVLPNLVQTLNASRFPVVLVGERSTTPCLEYELLPDHMSMYADVRPALRNCIDMTYDETCNANSLDNIKKSATVYTHAIYNVIMNSSGGLGFLAHFGNIIGLTSGHSQWEVLMDIKNPCLAHDAATFIRLLKERIG